MNKIKIAVGGIHFPLSMMSYFIRALKRRDDVDLWTFGPFTGSWTPWMYGMRMDEKYVVAPDLPLSRNLINKLIPSDVINAQMPWIPDLTLFIDAGWHTSNRPKGNIVALVETDPHVLRPIYVLPKSYSDISFCMQQNYMEGDEKYLPYAYDPTVHFHENLPIINDGCLIGLQYPQRNQLVELLRKAGMKIHYSTGEIFDEYRKIYCSSKIALNWSTLQDMPARFWEALGMGLPLVSNNVPDIKNFFVEGVDYLGFDNLQQAGQQFIRLISDPLSAEIIANSGHKKVLGHTYDERISQVLKEVKLL